MSQNRKKILAPIIIAGITIGFLASAYRFVFAKKTKSQSDSTESLSEKTDPAKDQN